MDPAADKIAMFVVYGTVAIRAGSFPVMALFCLGAIRDVAVTGQRVARFRSGGGVFRPDALGRAKTFLQSAAGIGLLAFAVYVDEGSALATRWIVAVMAATVAFSYASWLRYVDRYGWKGGKRIGEADIAGCGRATSRRASSTTGRTAAL
jgi:phosphatidylglycerophosphate synthase